MKVTPRPNSRPPPPDPCELDDCLHFLQKTWVPKIIWFLRGEPRRFGDLGRDLAGISPKVLTERLRMMEAMGVIRRTVLPTSPPQVEYALTELGEHFDPVFQAMVEVGAQLRQRFPRRLPSREGRRSSVPRKT